MKADVLKNLYEYYMENRWNRIKKRHQKYSYLNSICVFTLPVPEIKKKLKGVDVRYLKDEDMDAYIKEFRIEYLQNSDEIII